MYFTKTRGISQGSKSVLNRWVEQGFRTCSPYIDILADTIFVSLGLVTLVCLGSTVSLLVPEVVPNPGGDSHACPDEDVTEPWNHRMVGIGRVEII